MPWLGWTCGVCPRCREGRENLCARAEFTGYTRDGGYAERLAVDARYALPLGGGLDPVAAAPLLCAGLIGYRALRMCGDAERVGLFGFGSSAHLICQLLAHQGRRAFAFTRAATRRASRSRARWAPSGPAARSERPPDELDAAIVFAPVGELVPLALRALRPGGVVVCAGIHMSEIPAFPYELLWMERIAALGRQPDPRRRPRVPARWPPRPESSRGPRASRWPRRTRRSPGSATGASRARPCSRWRALV